MNADPVRREEWDIANRHRRDAGRAVEYTVRDADPITTGDLTYLPRKLDIELHRDKDDHLRVAPNGHVALIGPERKPDGTWTHGYGSKVRLYLSPDETPAWAARLVAIEEGRP